MHHELEWWRARLVALLLARNIQQANQPCWLFVTGVWPGYCLTFDNTLILMS